MKVKLNLKNRVLAFAIINGINQGSMAHWKIINQAKQVLGFSEEELKEYEIVTENNVETNKAMIKWNPEKAEKEKEYDIPSSALDLVKDELKKLNKQAKMTEDQAALAQVLEIE